jgi:hypothetical protein
VESTFGSCTTTEQHYLVSEHYNEHFFLLAALFPLGALWSQSLGPDCKSFAHGPFASCNAQDFSGTAKRRVIRPSSLHPPSRIATLTRFAHSL